MLLGLIYVVGFIMALDPAPPVVRPWLLTTVLRVARNVVAPLPAYVLYMATVLLYKPAVWMARTALRVLCQTSAMQALRVRCLRVLGGIPMEIHENMHSRLTNTIHKMDTELDDAYTVRDTIIDNLRTAVRHKDSQLSNANHTIATHVHSIADALETITAVRNERLKAINTNAELNTKIVKYCSQLANAQNTIIELRGQLANADDTLSILSEQLFAAKQ